MHCRDAPLHDATCQTCSTDSVANSGCRRPLLGRRGQPLPQPSRATRVCQRRLQLRAVFTYGESNDIRLRHIILFCTYNNGDPPYWHLAPVHCQVALKLRRRDFRGGLTQGPSLTQPLLPQGLANYATPLAPFLFYFDSPLLAATPASSLPHRFWQSQQLQRLQQRL